MHIIEIITGRVMKTYSFPAVIQQIRWNPSPLLSDVLAVVCVQRFVQEVFYMLRIKKQRENKIPVNFV